jgi:hypothetical protein
LGSFFVSAAFVSAFLSSGFVFGAGVGFVAAAGAVVLALFEFWKCEQEIVKAKAEHTKKNFIITVLEGQKNIEAKGGEGVKKNMVCPF